MKKFVGFICLSLIASVLFTSCATILSGGKTRIRVNEGTPPNAHVYLDGNYMGTAPCSFKIHKTMKNAQHRIDIKAQGYETQTVTTNRKFSAGFFILDICTGVIWTVIDLATGNLYKQKPKKIHYNLMPVGNTTMIQSEPAVVTASTNVAKPIEKTEKVQAKTELPIVNHIAGDKIYYTSLFSFGKCKQGLVKASKRDGTCIILTADSKEIKRSAKYIYINDTESSAFKLGNTVRYGNKIFGYKSGKVVSVPSSMWCIVETEKGDFMLKKQSVLLFE